jgi:hypothetical protein
MKLLVNLLPTPTLLTFKKPKQSFCPSIKGTPTYAFSRSFDD